MQPSVMAVDSPAGAHLLNQQQYQRFVLHRQRNTPQTFAARSRLVAMLIVIARQRIKEFCLPARRQRGAEQTVARLQVIRAVNQHVQAFIAELARPGKIIQTDGIALQMNIQRLSIIRPPLTPPATVNIPAYACRAAADLASPRGHPPG
jgi:hypothetical protein